MATNAARMLATDEPEAEEVEYGNSTQVSTNKTAHEFFYVLMQAGVYAQILHRQTRSIAEHMALGEFYGKLGDLVDTLIESYQGCYGLVMDYPLDAKMPPLNNPMAMLQGLSDYVKAKRKAVADESQFQNQIDEIATLIDSTLYKLKFLS